MGTRTRQARGPQETPHCGADRVWRWGGRRTRRGPSSRSRWSATCWHTCRRVDDRLGRPRSAAWPPVFLLFRSKRLSPPGWWKSAVAIEVGARPVIRHTTETCTPTDFSQSGEQGPRCVGLVDEDQASKSTEHVVTVGDIDACHLKNSFVAGYAMPGVNKFLST